MPTIRNVMIKGINAFKSKLSDKRDITIDFVGDSITWGLNHCSAEETFVAFFARFFSEKYDNYKVIRYDGVVKTEALPIDHFDGPIAVGGKEGAPTATFIRNGVGGNTVRRAINRKQDFLGKMPNGDDPDLTFLMFGINDALYSDKAKYVTAEQFEMNYDELISLLLDNTPTQPIVISPTYNGIDHPLDDYAEVSRRIAARYDLPFIDAHKLWSEHYSEGAPHFGQGGWLSESKSDACHFSPEGAARTAEFLFDAFVRMLVEA